MSDLKQAYESRVQAWLKEKQPTGSVPEPVDALLQMCRKFYVHPMRFLPSIWERDSTLEQELCRRFKDLKQDWVRVIKTGTQAIETAQKVAVGETAAELFSATVEELAGNSPTSVITVGLNGGSTLLELVAAVRYWSVAVAKRIDLCPLEGRPNAGRLQHLTADVACQLLARSLYCETRALESPGPAEHADICVLGIGALSGGFLEYARVAGNIYRHTLTEHGVCADCLWQYVDVEGHSINVVDWDGNKQSSLPSTPAPLPLAVLTDFIMEESKPVIGVAAGGEASVERDKALALRAHLSSPLLSGVVTTAGVAKAALSADTFVKERRGTPADLLREIIHAWDDERRVFVP